MTIYERKEIDGGEALERVRDNQYVQNFLNKEGEEGEKLVENHVYRAVERFADQYPGFDIAIAKLDRNKGEISDDEFESQVEQISQGIRERYAEEVGDVVEEGLKDESLDISLEVDYARILERNYLGGWDFPSESYLGGFLSPSIVHELEGVN